MHRMFVRLIFDCANRDFQPACNFLILAQVNLKHAWVGLLDLALHVVNVSLVRSHPSVDERHYVGGLRIVDDGWRLLADDTTHLSLILLMWG